MIESKLKASKMTHAIKLCLVAAAVSLMGNALADDTTRVIVSFKHGASDAAKAAVIAARGSVKRELPSVDAMSVDVPTQSLSGLQSDSRIAFVEPDVKRYPFSLTTPSTGSPYLVGQLVPYGIQMVKADQLPDTYAANRKVCIIDSGYDITHEDLSHGANITGDDDIGGAGLWSTDELHHGTHVSGTISALNNSGVGVVGVNPNGNLKLHIVKVFGADGWAYSSSLIAAADKCAAAGANVISMSLGGTDISRAEQQAFSLLQASGILSIAAAGNSGDTSLSYPASYPGVMSVAAIDENKQKASFSQYNNKVEISGPGVGVLSTVPMGTLNASAVTVGGTLYTVANMTGSPRATATAALYDFGTGIATDAGASGKVCLIKRGAITFGTKVANCEASGGVGAIVYNDGAAPDRFGVVQGTLGTTVTTIPSVGASYADGIAMQAQVGQSATVAVTQSAFSYDYYNGTSMATPHVSAVAALVWSYFPTCTANQIRRTLDNSAEDLGAPGRDKIYGFGLVNAKAAYDRIKAYGCDN